MNMDIKKKIDKRIIKKLKSFSLLAEIIIFISYNYLL